MDRKAKLLFVILVYLFIFGMATAQDKVLSGKIMDTLQNPLPYTNILAEPEEDLPMTFSISDEQGNYKLKLQQNTTYTIIISHLGYQRQTLKIKVINDLQKNFILHPAVNQLNEVVLNYKIPIIVKKDTIIYDTEAFVSGEERKLRDVLKKLPGVEVDREGNVTVQGKKVDKVLVEDKTFFTGNSKLAVNNIPADAVAKVEVLDNYSEIPFLKGLEDSDKMVMNIKLKEDKKQFAFGDLEAGGGYKERYHIHPNVFYYSPKTNVNFIGDLNNTGVKSFTIQDYLEFEGGFSKLLNDAGSYFSLYKDDFARYLTNRDFKENIQRFGAFNIRQSVSTTTDINAYVIVSDTDTETQSETLNTYISDTNFNEERNVTDQFDTTFLIGKATLDYEPSLEEDFSFSTFVKATKNNSNGIINTNNIFQSNQIQTITRSDVFSAKQHFSYSRKFSRKHTATLEAHLNYQKDIPETNWITDQEVLQGAIPLEEDTVFDIFQQKKASATSFDMQFKHYWVLSNFNHIYTSVGVNMFFNDFYSSEVQRLTNGTINDFSSDGFGNDFVYDFRDTFLGVAYKFQRGIFIFKPALYYHYYFWENQQFSDRVAHYKSLVLPQFTANVELKTSGKIHFDYRLNARFPRINQLANNFTIQSFNSVFRGNETLENELYHSVYLSYYKFNLFKSLLLNASITYNRKIKSLKTATLLNGIDQLNAATLINNPETNWAFNGNISKKINTIKYIFRGGYSYADFFRLVNDSRTKNSSKTIFGTGSIRTFFDSFPNVEVGYTKHYNSYETVRSKSDFQNDELFIDITHDFLKDFLFKAHYSRSNYENKAIGVSTVFDIANASLFYQKEDSPWGFKLSGSNLFNTRFRQQNTFSDFLISDQSTFLLPRIVMVTIAYKL